MKKYFIAGLLLLAFLRASAQLSMELTLDQDEFLPNEAIRLAVKITNVSGQELHLGADPQWLTFDVEAEDGNVVAENSDVPVVEPFDLESSMMATKHVDLEPYFRLGKVGRYKVTATMHIKEWGMAVNSRPIHFDVIHGGEVWSQDVGVLVSSNGPPEARTYTLIRANYLREQLRLYVQVSGNNGATVYKVAPLGPLVSFSSPESAVDRLSQLHVLWQTGAQSFTSVIVGPEGAVLSRDFYDDYNSRPHLMINDNGDVLVHGGVRRPRPNELPEVRSPDAVPSVPARQ
jgi:hypothetical protein